MPGFFCIAHTPEIKMPQVDKAHASAAYAAYQTGAPRLRPLASGDAELVTRPMPRMRFLHLVLMHNSPTGHNA